MANKKGTFLHLKGTTSSTITKITSYNIILYLTRPVLEYGIHYAQPLMLKVIL